MRYEYRYTKKDVWDFIRIWRWRKESRKGLILRLFSFCVFWIYLVEFLLYKQGIAVQCIAAPLVILAVCGLSLYRMYRQVSKMILGVYIILMLEDGYLKVVGRSYTEHDLAGTGETIGEGGLILIPVNKEPPSVFVLLPDRVFADELERRRFLEELERQKKYANKRQEEIFAQEREQGILGQQDALEQGELDAAMRQTGAKRQGSDIAMQQKAPGRGNRATDRGGFDIVKTQRWPAAVIAVLLAGLVVAAMCTRDWRSAGTDYVAWGMEDTLYGVSMPVPVEEQIRVLEESGLPVSAEARASLEQLMRENPDFRSYIENHPYIILLSNMGYPQYDYDTWEVVAYPEDVYCFDVEAFALEGSYTELIEVMEYLSDGEVRMELQHFKEDAVDWDKGTGTLTMAFRCNGHPYTVDLAVMDDWMDTSIVAELNEVLEQENCAARLYVCMDGGQGLILFYRDAEWAKNFERLTGLELYSTAEFAWGWM